MKLYVNIVRSILELRVDSELHRSLVVSEDLLWLSPASFDTYRDYQAMSTEQWLPLLCILILNVDAEVQQQLPNPASFQLPEQVVEPNYILYSI